MKIHQKLKITVKTFQHVDKNDRRYNICLIRYTNHEEINDNNTCPSFPTKKYMCIFKAMRNLTERRHGSDITLKAQYPAFILFLYISLVAGKLTGGRSIEKCKRRKYTLHAFPHYCNPDN